MWSGSQYAQTGHWGVSNCWTGIWNGTVEWTMEWTAHVHNALTTSWWICHFFFRDFVLSHKRSAVSMMAGTSSNPIVIDYTLSPETSLSLLKVVKAKEMYRYVQVSDSDIISGALFIVSVFLLFVGACLRSSLRSQKAKIQLS